MGLRLLTAGAFAVGIVFFSGCGGSELVNTAKLPDNYQCQYMKDVCKEAREFERNYAKLPPNEQKDAENVLIAYRLQCNEALAVCKKSAKKK